ncbi:low temperature requirement protein A [Arthrobacter sp. ISL-69]|uniref:low temperature requirement protein A n=1 Tax=Arthrobacter sp. ISL-69 TaxID=2819113 RepID=UPI001BEAA961|nr:low temperature requirement protein A [Arthrobacter sp. ISL-69]MBT2538890.1 low temperature requirement protein A [Arthrobacter sp. ISL-69]
MGTNPLGHALIRMGGRDPGEKHRTATPLELFFDLTFVIAFGVAGGQFAHEIAEGHFAAGLLGFGFTMFCVIWAWINFSWFASAYDTDDWIFRVSTMVQMLGVLILTMGIEPMFHSLVEGHHVDTVLIVAGYVIMRLALVSQWLRAARQDPPRRQTCLNFAKYLVVAQIGWVIVMIVPADILTTFLMIVPLFVLESAAPVLAERRIRTPWHAHHIAERYGLLAIIALGECLFGVVETLRAIVGNHGWTPDAAVVGFAGTAIAFGMWWTYFLLPTGQSLHLQRNRSFKFGYGHMPIFAAIAATGAGLHVAAYFIDHEAHISAAVAIASIAIPVAVFKITVTWLYSAMLGLDRMIVGVAAVVVLLLGLSVGLAALGVALPLCMLVICAALAVSVVVEEHPRAKAAHRRQLALQRLRSRLSAAGT